MRRVKLGSVDKGHAIALAAMFLGATVIGITSAATTAFFFEAESGTVSGAAESIQDSGASGGMALGFGPIASAGVLWSEDFASAESLNNLLGQAGDGIGPNNDPESSSNGYTSLTFHADHDDMCGTPATSRTITGNNAWPNHRYWCPNGGGHFMTAMNTNSYISISFTPRGNNNLAKIFPDSANKVCIDVNITGMGTRRWWDIAVLSESKYLSHMYPTNLSGLPGDVITNQPGLIYFDPSHFQENINVGMDADFLFVDHEGSRHVSMNGVQVFDDHGVVNRTITDKATRYKTCLKDNRNGTVTHTQNRPGGSVQTTILTNSSFPRGNKVFVILDKSYNPDKTEEPSAVVDGYTWHWDNFVISAE